MAWAGNITKIMTSNGKQLAATREMLTAVAWDQSVQFVSGNIQIHCFPWDQSVNT